MRLVFLLGKSTSLAAQVHIERENDEFNDIVQGNFEDSYRNLSYKSIMANTWVSLFCQQAEFVLKADDDMFVDMYELFVFTRQFLKTKVLAMNTPAPLLSALQLSCTPEASV